MKNILFFTAVFSVLCIGIFGEMDSNASDTYQVKESSFISNFKNDNEDYILYDDIYEFTYSRALYDLESYLNYNDNFEYELKNQVNNAYIIEAKFTGKPKLKRDCTYYVSENEIKVYE